MKWTVKFYDDFDKEFDELNTAVQDELLAHAELLATFGPQLGRPTVDTLNGSKHANMKELRFKANNGVWRVAFAFDPDREERQFYSLLATNRELVKKDSTGN